MGLIFGFNGSDVIILIRVAMIDIVLNFKILNYLQVKNTLMKYLCEIWITGDIYFFERSVSFDNRF